MRFFLMRQAQVRDSQINYRIKFVMVFPLKTEEGRLFGYDDCDIEVFDPWEEEQKRKFANPERPAASESSTQKWISKRASKRGLEVGGLISSKRLGTKKKEDENPEEGDVGGEEEYIDGVRRLHHTTEADRIRTQGSAAQLSDFFLQLILSGMFCRRRNAAPDCRRLWNRYHHPFTSATKSCISAKSCT